jgi:hypothetical protein
MDTQLDNLEPSPVKEKTGSKRDFWIGFIGWWVFNLIFGGLEFAIIFGIALIGPTSVGPSSNYSTLTTVLINGLGCLVLLANIGALIFFAFRRKQIALGMLVAFGVSIAISILIGVIAMVACFVILGQYNSGG